MSSTSSIVSVKGTTRRGVAAGGEQPRVRQFLFDPPDDAVDQAGEAEDEAGLDRRAASSGRSLSRGSSRSIRVIRAARSIRALSEISRPGPIAPPRYSPSAETASKLMPVPKSTDDAGLAEALVGGDRVDEAVGADLERVVDPDRHPGLHPGADRQALGVAGSARSSCSYWLPSGGTTEETQTASTSPKAIPREREEAGDPLGQLVAGRPGAGLEAPVLDQRARRRRRRGGSGCCRRRPRAASRAIIADRTGQVAKRSVCA